MIACSSPLLFRQPQKVGPELAKAILELYENAWVKNQSEFNTELVKMQITDQSCIRVTVYQTLSRAEKTDQKPTRAGRPETISATQES